MLPRIDPREPWDNMHGPSAPNTHWTTDNVGEAAPGVLTPLGASLWGSIGQQATHAAFVAIGALAEGEDLPPAVASLNGIFFGRLALPVELLTLLGDRMPGTSGQAVAQAIFGTVPDDIEYHPTKRRYPAIAWNLSRTFVGMPSRLERESPQFHRFWQNSIDALAGADLAATRRLLTAALVQFEAALRLQTIAVIGHAQVIHQALAGVVEQAGTGDLGLLSGSGGAEMAVIGDIWRASAGELTVAEVIREHGFHGPLEGEVSSSVWREDPSPLERLIVEYRGRKDPRLREAEMRARLPQAQAEVLAALPRGKRPGAKLVLTMAAKRIPLRGVGKRSFLQGFDVIRACARRVGDGLAESGVLESADDAFYLTSDELLHPPADARDLVARRGKRRTEYQRLSIPGLWKGMPEPHAIEESTVVRGRVERVQGLGVSAGVKEGVARVVTDPSFAEVEPDEILVAPTTDPSWASIMFISSGLVMDLGGPISHAAVVARELGLPCVVNTRTGTQMIRTGDRVRVDGEQGTVEILAPAG
jgi:phosphohistidine swiveling domain-containing protein